jgi:hypothetical protein
VHPTQDDLIARLKRAGELLISGDSSAFVVQQFAIGDISPTPGLTSPDAEQPLAHGRAANSQIFDYRPAGVRFA